MGIEYSTQHLPERGHELDKELITKFATGKINKILNSDRMQLRIDSEVGTVITELIHSKWFKQLCQESLAELVDYKIRRTSLGDCSKASWAMIEKMAINNVLELLRKNLK